ncbi:MAG: CBS domain-containing protein [Thermomicrobiales bacterium]
MGGGGAVACLDQAAVLLEWLPDAEIPGLLAELDPSDAAEILSTMTHPEAASLLGAMAPDDAADVVVGCPTMSPRSEFWCTWNLRTLPNSAGCWSIHRRAPAASLTPAFVAISPDMHAAQAIAALQRVAEEAETLYYVYVLDEKDHLLGVLSLHRLVLTRPDSTIRELMISDPVRVHADTDQESAATLLTSHNLLALPVVDDDNRLRRDRYAGRHRRRHRIRSHRRHRATGADRSHWRCHIAGPEWARWCGGGSSGCCSSFVAEAYTGTVLRHYEEKSCR